MTDILTAPNSTGPTVFISWSGELSRAIALRLREWLPDVIPSAIPWMSSEDISKGTTWAPEIANQLNGCKVAIVVLTQENQTTPWVAFESGAIFKGARDRYVCTLLCDLTSTQVIGPLSQFQHTEFNKEDLRKLCHAVSSAVSDAAHERLVRRFDKFWPDFEAMIQEERERHRSTKKPPRRETSEVLDEVLSTVRSVQRMIGQQQQEDAMRNAMRNVMAVHVPVKNPTRTSVDWAWGEVRDLRFTSQARDALSQMGESDRRQILDSLDQLILQQDRTLFARPMLHIGIWTIEQSVIQEPAGVTLLVKRITKTDPNDDADVEDVGEGSI